MTKYDPVEFTGKVLDQRNNLTGPDDGGKVGYPKSPKHVKIEQSDNDDKSNY